MHFGKKRERQIANGEISLIIDNGEICLENDNEESLILDNGIFLLRMIMERIFLSNNKGDNWDIKKHDSKN